MTLELTEQEAEMLQAAVHNHLGYISNLRRLSEYYYQMHPQAFTDFKEVEKECLRMGKRIQDLRNANSQQPASGEVQGETPV